MLLSCLSSEGTVHSLSHPLCLEMVAMLNLNTPFSCLWFHYLNMLNLIRLWLLAPYFVACHSVVVNVSLAQGGRKKRKGILSQIQVQLSTQRVANSTTDSVCFPASIDTGDLCSNRNIPSFTSVCCFLPWLHAEKHEGQYNCKHYSLSL